MPADLDALLTHVYVLVDDLLPRPRQRGRPAASGSSRPSTRSRTNSRSSATGVGRSLASSAAAPVGCWRSPPRSCTTGRSASPDGASSPTTTEESIV